MITKACQGLTEWLFHKLLVVQEREPDVQGEKRKRRSRASQVVISFNMCNCLQMTIIKCCYIFWGLMSATQGAET